MMKRILFLSFLLILILPHVVEAACGGSTSGSSPNLTAYDCSYDCVNLAVNTDAVAGDTVTVPSGTATWGSTLDIGIGINLIGAGIGSTVITGGSSGSTIWINPDDYSANQTFRISGFSFNYGTQSTDKSTIVLGQELNPGDDAKFHAMTNVRIDNNRFYNSGGDFSALERHAIALKAMIYALIDNNTFDNHVYPFWGYAPAAAITESEGGIVYEYFTDNSIPYTPGGQYSVIIEDNDINLGGSDCIVIEGRGSNRHTFRYNDIQICDGSHYSVFGSHPCNTGYWATMSTVLYGNDVTIGNNTSGRDMNARSAQSLFFYNNFPSRSNANINYSQSGANCPCAECQPLDQLPHDKYAWANMEGHDTNIGSGGYSNSNEQTCSSVTYHTSGTHYFNEYTSPIVGCGTLANIPGTCTVGQGYWATDQSTSDLTGMVGVNPATPISGTLYACTSTNVWTEYYTPYTYPHPLRTEELSYISGCTISGGAIH